MKKMYFLFMLAGILLAFSQCTVAQKGKVTASTATEAKGYTVLNAGEPITIYKYVHRTHSPKENDKYKPQHYFTTSTSDVLQPLTKANLKKAYPNNHGFHDALDANFKGDDELAGYDDFHKMYKVNHLLQNKQ